MIDTTISEQVAVIKQNILEINTLMETLYASNVEVRIVYAEAERGNPPTLNLWRATEHVDYLKETTQ